MNGKTSIITKIFLVIASIMTLTGFAGLFTRSIGFSIPFISGTIIRSLDRYTVYAETLKGRAPVIRGEHWFFFITVSVILVMAIAAILINALIRKYDQKT